MVRNTESHGKTISSATSYNADCPPSLFAQNSIQSPRDASPPFLISLTRERKNFPRKFPHLLVQSIHRDRLPFHDAPPPQPLPQRPSTTPPQRHLYPTKSFKEGPIQPRCTLHHPFRPTSPPLPPTFLSIPVLRSHSNLLGSGASHGLGAHHFISCFTAALA